MKAVVVKQPGGPEVLEYVSVPTPKVKPGWSLVKVHGFGINHSEVFTRQGKSPDVQFPRILGIEAVGEIAETTTDNLRVGQTVVSIMGEMGRAFDGGYAEYVLLPNDQIFPVRTKLSWDKLAAVPETYYTAFGVYQSLQIRPTDQVLIRAATSGVGVALKNLIKAKYDDLQVDGTTRSAQKVKLLRDLGFDQGLVTGTRLTLGEAIGQYDKIADLVGPATILDSMRHLKEYGIASSTGQLGGQWTLEGFDPIMDVPNNCYLTGFYSGIVDGQKMQSLIDFIELYDVDVTPHKIFKLTEVAEAHRYLDRGQGFGKVIVLI